MMAWTSLILLSIIIVTMMHQYGLQLILARRLVLGRRSEVSLLNGCKLLILLRLWRQLDHGPNELTLGNGLLYLVLIG